MKDIGDIFKNNKLEPKGNLYEYLLAIYFTIEKITPKDRNKLNDILKTTIVQLITNDESKSIIPRELEVIEEQYSEEEN